MNEGLGFGRMAEAGMPAGFGLFPGVASLPFRIRLGFDVDHPSQQPGRRRAASGISIGNKRRIGKDGERGNGSVTLFFRAS